MTKYLVKAKKGCTFISTNGNGEFLDEYRYRVFSNPFDIREWDSRRCLDIYGEVRDDATDDKLKQYLKDGDEGLKNFFEEFSLTNNKVEQTPVVEPAQDPVVLEDKEANAPVSKKNKHSKK